jgi:hypothetical protein
MIPDTMSPDAQEPESERTADVLSSLPRHRPGRRTERRAANNGAPGADADARTAAKPARGARKAPRSAGARGSGKRASAQPARRPAIPQQGFESEEEVRVGKGVEPPSRLELATSAVELVADGVEELVKASASAARTLVKRTLGLIPKP